MKHKNKPVPEALIMLIMISALLVSCVSYERCVARFGRTTTDTLLVPFEVVVPGDSIATVVYIDSIRPGDTVWVESPLNRARIQYWWSKYLNALHIVAHCDTIVVRDTIRVAMPVILDPPPPKPPGRIQRAWLAYQQTVAIALPLVLLIFFIIRTTIKHLKK